MAMISTQFSALDDPEYPSSDGQPMSDNTKQFQWIVAVQGGLATQYVDDPDVAVFGNLLWYPVQGQPKVRVGPDVMVVLGRPKGDRGSYIQHREEGITPQVVFEVLSPGNTPAEMELKLAFYDQYGVQEYYILDPDEREHRGYLRDPATGTLEPIADLFGWVSPSLGIRFEMTDELRIFKPDGSPFQFYKDVAADRQAERRAKTAERRAKAAAAQRADAEAQRADQNAQQAAADRQARLDAEQRAETEARRAETERQEADRLRAQLRVLGIDPDA